MKTQHLLFLLVVIIIGFGCTERIDLELDETYSRLVVDGELTDEAKPHTVKLSLTGGFLDGNPDLPVTDAIVTIQSTDGTHTLTELEEIPGTYKTDSTYAGKTGATYTLNVELKEEINGQINYTATSTMFPSGILDSIGVEWIEHWEVFEIQCYAWDPPSEDFYMFDIYRNGIHLTDTISEKFIVDDRMYNGNYTNGIGVGYLFPEKPDEDIQPGDTISLRLGRITKEHYYYVADVQTETGYQNPLFGGPPANIKGNISDGAIGFFGTFSVLYASTIYRK